MTRYWVNRLLDRIEVKDTSNNSVVESWSARWDESSKVFYVAWEDERLANEICSRLNSEEKSSWQN
jgi:hypothetical protein